MQIGRIEETLANLNPSIPTCIIYTLRKGRVTSALDALSIKERQYLFNDKVPTILYISHCDNLSDNTWWKINSAFVQQFGIIPCREVIHGSIRTCSSNGWDPEPRTELMTAIQKNSGTEWIQEIQNEMRNRGTLLGRGFPLLPRFLYGLASICVSYCVTKSVRRYCFIPRFIIDVYGSGLVKKVVNVLASVRDFVFAHRNRREGPGLGEIELYVVSSY